jgi:hypothetical protein
VRAYAITLGAVTFLAATPSARAQCRPTAVPQGDPQLVSLLRERLTANGIETQPSPSCPAVRVIVAQRGQQVHLRVTDAYERLGEREVQDVATAAAIIESWTLQEIEAGSLPADAPPVVSPPEPASPAPWFEVGAAFRTAMTEQSSTWMGATVAACARLGWSCVGVTVGYAKDIEATGTSSTGGHELSQLDARATAEVPRAVARFVVTPGLSLGYGLQWIATQHLDAHLQPVTMTESVHALRGGLQLRIAHAVARSVSIFTELAADHSFARSSSVSAPESWLGLSLGARFGLP